MKGNDMTIDQVVIIYGTIVGACAFFVGLAIGIIGGYFIGRSDRRKTANNWDWDKLKRSDHYHHERKRMDEE